MRREQPEPPYDYHREIVDARNHDRSIRDERWNGTRWSEQPDPAEYAGMGDDR